jgi:hypothetical protein
LAEVKRRGLMMLRLLAFVLLGLDSVAVATAVGAAGKVTGPAQ